MIVCHCNQITEKEIRDSIKNGSKTIEDIINTTKACSIGCCYSKIIKILENELEK